MINTNNNIQSISLTTFIFRSKIKKRFWGNRNEACRASTWRITPWVNGQQSRFVIPKLYRLTTALLELDVQVQILLYKLTTALLLELDFQEQILLYLHLSVFPFWKNPALVAP